MVEGRERLREIVSRLARTLGPLIGDTLIGVLYETVDWSDEVIADLVTVGTGGTAGIPTQAAEEAVDNVAITAANRLYRMVGDIYERLGLMTPEERRIRDEILRGAEYAERAQIGPLDVIPAYVAGSVGYHGLRTIREFRDDVYGVVDWIRERLTGLGEKYKRPVRRPAFGTT